MSKKRKYVAYRNESDSDEDTTTAYARMVAVSNGGRRQVIVPCSPMKVRAKNLLEDQAGALQTDNWEPTLDNDLVFDDEVESPPVESRPITVANTLAKCYTNSDAPLHKWMGISGRTGFREEYLLEELRLEGHCSLATTLRKWNGTYFERIALADMGLRVQLGHQGMSCLCPQRGHVSFVVIHTNAIHLSHCQQLLRCEWYPATLHFPQSACTKQVLEFFLVLMWSSKVSGYEFYTSLERLTDNTRLNIPKSRFLYYLIIAMDANFRLKNRARSSSTADPGLHTGLAYFIPDKPYVEHILKNASQTDISTCSGFRTLAHAESKHSSGLYANMDFIFFSSIMPLLLSVVISYDIACQWKINLTKRINKLPEHLQIPAAVALATFIFGIPKFHCPAHEEKCAIPHSLNLIPGIGRTDGEGIERNWAEMNRVANSTKEMGPSSRHDVLDDHFGHHNWRKYTGLGLSLWRKLLNAVKERTHHQSFLHNFDSSIDEAHRGEWSAMIEAWERDKSSLNPYVLSRISLSEAQVRVNFVDKEKIAIRNGRKLPHETTPSSFININMALVLEDAQRRIKIDLPSSLSANQYTELHQHRVTLQRQLDRFRIIQQVYMVGIGSWITQQDRDSSDDIEDESLWLPSTLPASDREAICTNDIAHIEAELRKGQCCDALDRLRRHLHTKSHFIKHRNLDLCGQRANTHATSFLARFDSKINAATVKYRVAWSALLELVGINELEREFQCLQAKDIVAPVDTVSGARSTTGMRGKKRSERDASRGLGQGYQMTSWIWLTLGVQDDMGLNDVLRVEWAKSRARAQWWNEEVLLLKEEMRRTRQFLAWHAQQWRSVTELSHQDAQIVAGAAAYAQRQATIQHALLARFTSLWGTGVSAV
ncbi:uncharacterized protein F5147DRAFT_746912 [Suillus discolor]|uniref:CxC2-like cysteine cluster KDZ transposase-associated domain-containing protein n=1 Tax=Suillus discolor TaxID=1912936 RepID=A0A9P7JRD7_9AGAM|nr:uncharacterized protein F5147DRAFT_746912 [Suillus discolor]KAG2101825.1 hypothetical protein F5147DRAFT_746912 [Suillus discolor]